VEFCIVVLIIQDVLKPDRL